MKTALLALARSAIVHLKRLSSHRATRAIVIIALLAFGSHRALLLDVFPAFTNDSMSYIHHSLDYTSLRGIVESETVKRGHKYAGCSMFIALCRGVATVVGTDPLTTVVTVQRLLYLAAIIAAVWALGPYSLPVIYFLSSPSVVAYANLVLTEGILVPLAVVYAAALIQLHRVFRGEKQVRGAVLGLLTLLAFASLLFMVMTKYQSSVFLLPFLVIVWRARRTTRRHALVHLYTAAIIMVGFVVVFGLHLSATNYAVYGRFFPAANTGMILYWGAHYSTFVLRPANRARADLHTEFRNGSAYPRMHEVIKQYPHGLENSRLLRQESLDLLEKAGISYPRAQLRSFCYALVGGEKFELKSYIRLLLGHNSKGGYFWRPAPIKTMGEQAYFDKYNNGQFPKTIPGLSRKGLTPGKEVRAQRQISVVLLVTLGLLLLLRKIGWLEAAMFVSFAIGCAAVARLLTDLWRILLSGWMIFAMGGMLGFKRLLELMWSKLSTVLLRGWAHPLSVAQRPSFAPAQPSQRH